MMSVATDDYDFALKVGGAFAVVIAALITVLLGYFSQIKIKRVKYKIQDRNERVAQRRALLLPLLRFSYELDGRIGRILDNLHTDWLKSAYLERIKRNEGFAQSPLETGYFIISSVYVFACFFGWTEAVRKSIGITGSFAERIRAIRWFVGLRRWISHIFISPAKTHVFFFDIDISVVRRLFQYQELFQSYSTSRKLNAPRDAFRLHRHIQNSIGEMMLQRDGDSYRCKTFREFYDAYREYAQFRYWFIPLEELFSDLSNFEPNNEIERQVEMKNDIRPLRLLAIRYWCRVLMENLAKELGIETPPPGGILVGLSDALRSTITSVTIEDLELYLAGIPFKR